jgi:hypothetical protein
MTMAQSQRRKALRPDLSGFEKRGTTDDTWSVTGAAVASRESDLLHRLPKGGTVMHKILYALSAASLVALATPATAASTLVADGITYTLTLNSVTNSGLTGNFTLAISGINTASDTEGGRSGINAFAFTDPTVGTITGGTSAGFTFMTGGLNSSGCDGSGGFFCFTNSGYVLPSGSSTSLNFSITSNTTGSFATWTPDFKIDWTGSKKNYDLVSLPIPVNGVPEPASWALMMIGFGAIGWTVRRRRRASGIPQIA